VPAPRFVTQRGGNSCGEGGIRTLGRILMPPPSSARPFGPARFLPPHIPCSAGGLRAEWREAVAACSALALVTLECDTRVTLASSASWHSA
jgi:hypothetical protein